MGFCVLLVLTKAAVLLTGSSPTCLMRLLNPGCLTFRCMRLKWVVPIGPAAAPPSSPAAGAARLTTITNATCAAAPPRSPVLHIWINSRMLFAGIKRSMRSFVPTQPSQCWVLSMQVRVIQPCTSCCNDVSMWMHSHTLWTWPSMHLCSSIINVMRWHRPYCGSKCKVQMCKLPCTPEPVLEVQCCVCSTCMLLCRMGRQ